MELPEAKGTYVLIAFAGQMTRLEIGRLGTFAIVPGFYAYVGSAFGSGGLRARIGHHLESTAALHWHIDFLLRLPEQPAANVSCVLKPSNCNERIARHR